MASLQAPRMLPLRLARAASLYILAPAATTARSTSMGIRHSSSLPSVASVSFWKSLIPKPFRRSGDESLAPKPKTKGWNPATFYIVIFMLIGSMSIQMIRIRTSFETFIRQSDAKIAVLREVVEKIQNGEKVDVERALGTGDAERELEWEQVLREIERGGNVSSRRRNTPAEPQKSEATASDQSQKKTLDKPEPEPEPESSQKPPPPKKGGFTAGFY